MNTQRDPVSWFEIYVQDMDFKRMDCGGFRQIVRGFFNVRGKDYRLLEAIHYDKQRIYTLQFLTIQNTTRTAGRKSYENETSQPFFRYAPRLRGALPRVSAATHP